METDLIKTLEEIHTKIDSAFEKRNISNYMSHFDEHLKYSDANMATYNKEEFMYQTEKLFKKAKYISTAYYRLKSSFGPEILTEKIARKTVLQLKNFFFFSKKQTIQTEEIFHWKIIAGEWKITAVEIVLEERY